MKKRNKSLQLIRIVAMMMIIFDHLIIYVDIPMKMAFIQLFNSGTIIFLFLSGLLFGKNNVDKWGGWFKNRLLRICVPMWIFVAFDIVLVHTIWGYFNAKYVFAYFLNIQGFTGGLVGASQLWFLTLIMICYLLTPLLQRIKSKLIKNRIVIILIGVLLVIVHIVLSYSTSLKMAGEHKLSWCFMAIAIYAIGYYFGDSIIVFLKKNIATVALSIVTVFAIVFAVLANKYFNGQIIYDQIIFWYCMLVVDLFIVIIVYRIGELFNKKKKTPILNHFDSISYEVYLVHVIVIEALTKQIMKYTGTIIYILLTLLISYLLALALHFICDKIYKIFKS